MPFWLSVRCRRFKFMLITKSSVKPTCTPSGSDLDISRVRSGHGPDTTIEIERTTNPFFTT